MALTKRGKGKFSRTLGMREAYNRYVEDYGRVVNYKTYAEIIKTYNKKIQEKILNEAYEYMLPYGLGSIRIKKKKMFFDTKFMKADWSATKELDKKVYHMNEHTNGYNYRFLWNKKKMKVINMHFYSFTAARHFKRDLAKVLKSPDREIDYFE